MPMVPVRSVSHIVHTKTATQHLDHVLKRTVSCSAHIFANSKKPFLQAQRTLKTKGREVFHPSRVRAERAAAAAAALLEDIQQGPASTSEDSASSDSSSSILDRSKPEVSDVKGQSAATTHTEGSPAAGAPARAADVSRALAEWTRNRRGSGVSPLTSTPEQPSDMSSSPASSAPSTPERPSRTARTPGRQPRANNTRATQGQRNRRRAQSTSDGSEPVRYARPACPENSLPCVIFEQRYENPFKNLRPRPRANSGAEKAGSEREDSGSMKSSPSLRRVLGSFTTSLSDIVTGAADKFDVSARSRRSSVASTCTTASDCSVPTTSSAEITPESAESAPVGDSQSASSGLDATTPATTAPAPAEITTPETAPASDASPAKPSTPSRRSTRWAKSRGDSNVVRNGVLRTDPYALLARRMHGTFKPGTPVRNTIEDDSAAPVAVEAVAA
ncbi:hypothetical protein OH77DRAFT_1424054 [Trametes cingulata]|nr:hypothetical protein OH77DRAFT_1424054 [Trametes cingulata]